MKIPPKFFKILSYLFVSSAIASGENMELEKKDVIDWSGMNLMDLPEFALPGNMLPHDVSTIILQSNKFDVSFTRLVGKILSRFPDVSFIDLRKNIFSAEDIQNCLQVRDIFSSEINAVEKYAKFSLIKMIFTSACNFEGPSILIDYSLLNSDIILQIINILKSGMFPTYFTVDRDLQNTKLDILFEALEKIPDEKYLNQITILGVISNDPKSFLQVTLNAEDLFEQPAEEVDENGPNNNSSEYLPDSELNPEPDLEYPDNAWSSIISTDSAQGNNHRLNPNKEYLKLRDNIAYLLHIETFEKIQNEERNKSILARLEEEEKRKHDEERFKNRILEMFANFCVDE